MLSEIALNNDECEVAGVVEAHIRRSWQAAYGTAPTSSAIGTLLRLIHLQFIDVEPGERDRLSAMDDLRSQVLTDPNQAEAAFSHLVAHCTRLRSDQSGADTSTLLSTLAHAGVGLQAAPDYRADIAALRAWTSRRLATATRFTRLIECHPGSVIERLVWPGFVEAAQQNSVLLVGEPGAGKTGIAYRLAETEIAASRDVVFIPVDIMTVNGLAALRAELGISHELGEILTNWPGAQRGLLIVDALDAARKSEIQTTLRVVIEDVMRQAGSRWNVVASIRSYDLRQGAEWARLFRGRPPTPDHADPGFSAVRHILVARLTEPELAQITTFSPRLKGLYDTASEPLRGLLRNIFNLRLLAELIEDGIVTSALVDITTQSGLLDIYWNHRIRRSDGNHDRRELALRAVVDQMLVSRSLQAIRHDVLAQADPAAIVELEQLDILRAEDEYGQSEDTLLFSHHILFDYAVARLVFRRGRDSVTLVDRLVREPVLVLMLRPSLSLAFSDVWSDGQSGRQRFWSLVFAVAREPSVPPVGQLIGAVTIAEQAKVLVDLQPLLDALAPASPLQSMAELVLQHLTSALLARPKADASWVGSDVAPWMAFAEALSQIGSDAAMNTVRILVQSGTAKPGELSHAQLALAGAAARRLLEYAWSHDPRIGLFIINSINGVANTTVSNPQATIAILRRALDPEHIRQFGYEELHWIARHVRTYASHDLKFIVDLYASAYDYEEMLRDAKTSISNSAITGLTSTRRQDYEMAWWSLADVAPWLLDEHPAEGTRAIARGLDGYIRRHEIGRWGENSREEFNFDGRPVRFVHDGSYGWNGQGVKHYRDAPVLLDKFDDFLERLSVRENAQEEFVRVVEAVADEAGNAVLWARLLAAAAKHPTVFGPPVLSLASATPVLGSLETRFQVGNYLKAVFSTLSSPQKTSIEHAILDLSGPQSSSKKILAGCLSAADCVTPEMQSLQARLAADVEAPANSPAMRFEFSSRLYNTDAYLADIGVDVTDEHSVSIRDLMRPVEALPNTSDPSLSLEDARRRLDLIDPLVDRLVSFSHGEIDQKLYEIATGIAAEAAHRVAIASFDVIDQTDVRDRLKRIFLFAKESTFPSFSQDHEDSFHDQASWGAPSARNGAAAGLMALARSRNPLDPDVQAAVRELARDRVCDVRLQIVQNLYVLRDNNPEWVWAEIERVVEHEYTRQVVDSAIHSLAHVADLDISRAIRIAKRVLDRYSGQEGPGIGQVCQTAASLIVDIHFVFSFPEADEFYAEQLADPSLHVENLHAWVARHSDKLTIGDDTGSDQDVQRAKTIEFYLDTASAVSEAVKEIYSEHDPTKSRDWPLEVVSKAQALNSVLDDMALRIYFASGGSNDADGSHTELGRRWRLYRELVPVLDRLAECSVVHTAYYLIQSLENFIPTDPAGVFRLIVKSVMASSRFGYTFESMGADVIVRIVEKYLADYRDVFSDDTRLDELMACLNLFVSAGWPAAQSVTFRLAEIWR
ncbi:ATP-binding protein [Burkholderia cenocepacia]|uniref:ATP-binding protein n=1 Tax=Burkholderia cenocepacia TaxID=95486 RepID=UPI000752A283|nr:ATP-binding protein [Burkholderia cenocepacia]MBR8252016.1 ATP-binding protein [Burkholderia cenocepacia]MBR8285566.1 ATP-binding protein [Burkholderia cenocepacia]MCA8009535.1 ATP-binding protein [Burkholderia cenocepacia]MDN7677699.1 ATP-binding protein [Burkholderia cenocepacia]MEB2545018.1 ATP-binding protein [Burkholderia cenocepacia]